MAVICYSGQEQALLRVKLSLLSYAELVFIRLQLAMENEDHFARVSLVSLIYFKLSLVFLMPEKKISKYRNFSFQFVENAHPASLCQLFCSLDL